MNELVLGSLRFALLAWLIYIFGTYGLYGPSNTPAASSLHLFLPVTGVSLVSSTKRRGFCMTLASALINGYDPILYNWDVKLEGGEAYGAKVSGLLEQLKAMDQIPESDVVVMADALDVLFQLPPEDLVRRFREYQQPVIVAAELDCWPIGGECFDTPPSPLPDDLYQDAFRPGVEPRPVSSTPRHANAGLVMGGPTAVRNLLHQVMEVMEDPSFMHATIDQGAFNILLHRRVFALDYRIRLMWCNAFDEGSLVVINHGRHPDGSGPAPGNTSIVPWHLYPPLAKHALTGETPVMLHFNGPPENKALMEPVWNDLWYGMASRGFASRTREALRGRTVRIARGQAIHTGSATDICADVLSAFQT